MNSPQSRQMAGPTPDAPGVALASLAEVTDDNDQTGEPIIVHFNPTSLQLAVSNELKDTTSNERKQYIAKTSAKLTMELIFDTTDTGEDVTVTTKKIQAFLVPQPPQGQRTKPQTPPPLVLFEWGTLKFKGIAENYKEVIDFFSANGVPLRASVNLTLSRQDHVFDQASGNAPTNGLPQIDDNIFDTPPASPGNVANQMKNPQAARKIASDNKLESLRFAAGASLNVKAGISLGAASPFSCGGQSGSVAGFNTGIQMGVKIDGQINANTKNMSLADMAKLPASQGAFNGLHTNLSSASGSSISVKNAQKALNSSNTGTSAAGFGIGGKESGGPSSGLRSDVGASRLHFD